MSTQDEINRLDLAYQKLTGHRFKASSLLTGREYAWSNFLTAGYTIHDLEFTILWIKRGILDGKRYEAALGFRRLIGELQTFEDENATANAERRNAKPHVPPKEQVVQQFRPTVTSAPVKSDAKPIGFYIEQMRKAAG
jgi:hypothetical protein